MEKLTKEEIFLAGARKFKEVMLKMEIEEEDMEFLRKVDLTDNVKSTENVRKHFKNIKTR